MVPALLLSYRQKLYIWVRWNRSPFEAFFVGSGLSCERPASLQHHPMTLVSRASSQLHRLWTVLHCSSLSSPIHLLAAVNRSSQAVTPQPLQWLSFCLESTFPRFWSSSLGPGSLISPLLSECWFPVIPRCGTISPGICPSMFTFSSCYWCRSNMIVI